MLFYREVGDKDKGSLSLWIVAVCEKRLFRFILSKNSFEERKILLDLYSSTLTIYGSLRARILHTKPTGNLLSKLARHTKEKRKTKDQIRRKDQNT